MQFRFPCALFVLAFALTPAEGQTGIVNITQSMVPFTITTPGEYRLAQNVVITNSNLHGITVNASDVTIDLHGFELVGAGRGTACGIHQTASFQHLSLSNGIVRLWRTDTDASPTDTCYGIRLDGSHNTMRDLTVTECDRGISLGPLSEIVNSTVYSNRTSGLVAGRGCNVAQCTAYGTGRGFEGGPDTTFVLCTAYNNQDTGFIAAKDVDFNSCTANGNATGIECGEACDIIGSVAFQNKQYGMVVGRRCTIRTSTANENGADGIHAGEQCEVDECTTHANAHAGIRISGTGNTLKGNKTMENGWGIVVEASGNLLSMNISGASAHSNYSLTGTNTVAPIVSTSEAASSVTRDVNIDLGLDRPAK